ncbi:MAG: bifunctional riboflavin kinase/FAD synthetase [Acidimicrobiia bacterium]|nr:bifunctional riboflavin kinase/FAD synthetase [Acidimicrobiia bacterium]NNK91424.1 bifunctional riboflavin kinase/FAD synthetase [Acidimicrobiia bacterium]
MKVLRGDPGSWEAPETGTSLTIGVYDGVHRGHAHVIGRAVEVAGDRIPGVLTFDRHPLTSSAPDHAPRLLTRLDQKLEQLEALGVGVVGLLSFDDRLRRLSPEDFAADIVAGAMGAKSVVVGRDFRFGFERAGDVDLLIRMGPELGFEVEALDLVGSGAPFASTVIRKMLEAGDVDAAAAMLGRPFELRGTVVHGDSRGRTIGIPTANLEIVREYAVPRRGVYVAEVTVADSIEQAVVNVGVRPTFGGGQEVIEVHLLDFEGDLYDSEIAVRFLTHVRDEQRFDGIDELVDQIHRDIGTAREQFARRS